MHRQIAVCLAVCACAALSARAYGRDLRACLSIQDVNQRIECLEGRAQPESVPVNPAEVNPVEVNPAPPPLENNPASIPNFSASFDCDKAASQSEIIICSDSVLAQLDGQMGQAYSRALATHRDRLGLLDEQRRWVALRDNQCRYGIQNAIRTCLIQMTTARIKELNAPVEMQSTITAGAPVVNAPTVFTGGANIVPYAAPALVSPHEQIDLNSHAPTDEGAASRLMIENIRSLLTSGTQDVRFFPYKVDKKDLETLKSDMPMLRVVYQERVFFDTDKADLRKEAVSVVKSIATILRQQKQKIALFVAGHTDSRGSDDYNLRLSIRRAEAVARAIKKEGAGSALIWRVGFGKSIPIRPNNSERNMGLNRRVEFLIASRPDVITAWIKNEKTLCEDESCGVTSAVANFQAAPINGATAKPIEIEIPSAKPIEIKMEFHPIEVGPPLQ